MIKSVFGKQQFNNHILLESQHIIAVFVKCCFSKVSSTITTQHSDNQSLKAGHYGKQYVWNNAHLHFESRQVCELSPVL